MSDRLIKRDNYLITLEETNKPSDLYQMFESVAPFIKLGKSHLQDLADALPSLTGLDFISMTYYQFFISPSNLVGYTLIGLQGFPDPDMLDEELIELYKQLDDSELSRTLIQASHDDESNWKLNNMTHEADLIIKARIAALRSL
jgi:hypothetical protein